jgi:FixJ family two-component response regulator
VRRCGARRARDGLARVGEGRKNREVADALFISVKTVEANLSRKLIAFPKRGWVCVDHR